LRFGDDKLQATGGSVAATAPPVVNLPPVLVNRVGRRDRDFGIETSADTVVITWDGISGIGPAVTSGQPVGRDGVGDV